MCIIEIMDIYFLFATLSFLIQVIVLVLLITSYMFKRKQKFRRHGILMLSAVVLHASMILTIMVPSFSVIAFTTTGLPITTVLTAIVHATFGTTTLVLGVWIVGFMEIANISSVLFPEKEDNASHLYFMGYCNYNWDYFVLRPIPANHDQLIL
ncbi:hypothetical protein IMZ68_04940 [Candidatus Bathyarchaeota archaeon]|nr:hypothetical protein [Candidatus Bathyarchaeota archaeon]